MLYVKRSFKGLISSSLPNLCAAGCFLLVLTVLASFTGQWCWQPNGYNSFALQADAWLNGRLDLGRDYPWLELAIYEGRYYVSFPPFPSYLLLPLVALFGTQPPDGIISLLFSLAGVWMSVSLAKKAGLKEWLAVFLTLFLYLGTGYLFLALTPAVWFFAQTLCFNLSIFALYFALTSRGGWSLFCWACAVGCRPMVLLYLPVLLMLIYRSHHAAFPRDSVFSIIRRRWYWVFGPLIMGGSYMILNAMRFGSIFEFGHNYLPEFQRETYGQFSLTYFWNNFKLLFRFPAWDSETQFISFQPFEAYFFALINPLNVLAIVISLIHAFQSRNKKDRGLILAILACSLVYVLILCCHRTLGGWQFGNRYFKDIMPYLFAALCISVSDTRRFRLIAVPMFVMGFSLHLLGTIITWNYWW